MAMTPTSIRLTRPIVLIDEDKCDGCGDCVPACHEGAIRIINGKAKLVAENLCDGLGACLGHCPRGAITVEHRPAEAFDEQAVEQHLQQQDAPSMPPEPAPCGCPGAKLQMMTPPSATSTSNTPDHPAASAAPTGPAQSRLGQWPVQLALLPPTGPVWTDADVLIAADCVPFTMADFHDRMLAGKSLAIACPKLDDPTPYVQKLAHIFANNTVRSITVARMEVPCCGGLVQIVQAALQAAGRTDIPLHVVNVGIDGQLKD